MLCSSPSRTGVTALDLQRLKLSMAKSRRSLSPTVLCVRISDVKRFEKTEDCFILEFDPCKPIEISDDDPDDDDDVTIVAEKDQIASRHYPHARHLCPQCPFATTQHQKHCKKVRSEEPFITYINVVKSIDA